MEFSDTEDSFDYFADYSTDSECRSVSEEEDPASGDEKDVKSENPSPDGLNKLSIQLLNTNSWKILPPFKLAQLALSSFSVTRRRELLKTLVWETSLQDARLESALPSTTEMPTIFFESSSSDGISSHPFQAPQH